MKTKDISKFELEWQILRTQLKGKYNDDLEYKFQLVFDYFNKTKTYDRYERIYNWIEGLLISFKNEKRIFLEQKLIYLKQLNIDKTNVDYNLNYDKLNNYSDDIKINLLKDLMSRNKIWLKNGYYNNELNNFIDIIIENIKFKQKINKYIIDLEQYRNYSKSIKNKHKFLF